jgi:hypothetical protein
VTNGAHITLGDSQTRRWRIRSSNFSEGKTDNEVWAKARDQAGRLKPSRFATVASCNEEDQSSAESNVNLGNDERLES